MAKKTSPTLIGTFVVGAVALAVVAVVVFGSGKLFEKTAPFVLFFTGSVNGLEVGAPVKLQGVPIGSVTQILITLTPQDRRMTVQRDQPEIPVFIEIDQKNIYSKGVGFDLTDRAIVRELVKRGLRAQLQTQSFITGMLFVELSVQPDTPAVFRQPAELHEEFVEIPTVPTTFEKLQTSLTEIMDSLKKVKLEPLIESVTELSDNINNVVESPSLTEFVHQLPATMTNLNDTLTSYRRLADDARKVIAPLTETAQGTATHAQKVLAETEKVLKRVDELLDPNSPLMYELVKTLQDLSAAARAIEGLSDELQRNPSALIRGRAEPEDDQ